MESNRLSSFDLVASGFSSNIVGHFDYLNTDDNTSMEEGEELFSNVRKYLEDAQEIVCRSTFEKKLQVDWERERYTCI